MGSKLSKVQSHWLIMVGVSLFLANCAGAPRAVPASASVQPPTAAVTESTPPPETPARSPAVDPIDAFVSPATHLAVLIKSRVPDQTAREVIYEELGLSVDPTFLQHPEHPFGEVSGHIEVVRKRDGSPFDDWHSPELAALRAKLGPCVGPAIPGAYLVVIGLMVKPKPQTSSEEALKLIETTGGRVSSLRTYWPVEFPADIGGGVLLAGRKLRESGLFSDVGPNACVIVVYDDD